MKRVSEFAKAKGITRGRAYQLVRAGALPAQVLRDGSIILEESAMDWQPRCARPLSPAMAWHLLSALEGVWPAGIRDAERARIRRHLTAISDAADPARELAAKVSARARLEEFFAHPEDAADLRNDPRVRLSGVGAPGSRMMAGDVVEGYVSESDLAGLRHDYLLKERPHGNVRLRVGGVLEIGRAAIAADLADWRGPREVREANRIVDELLEALMRETRFLRGGKARQ